MGYSNPTTSAEYTLPASTELIGSTIANAAYYTSDVYAQSLTVAAKCTIKNVTVESGGRMTKATMTAANSATFTSINVGNSGEVRLGNYNNASKFTVIAGGKLYTGSSVNLHNADIKAGATWSRLDSTRVGGRETNIAQGVTYALGKVMGDDFYISNGVIRNLDVTARTIGGSTYKEFDIYELIVSGGFVNNGARLVVSNTGNSDDAAEVYDLTIRTGGSATIQSGLLVSNLTAETGASVGLGGAVCIDIDIATGVTMNYGTSNTLYLGGGKTTIASGVVTSNRLGADFAAAAGVGTDLEVANTYNINILSGFTVSSGNVLAGGMLTVSSGGSAKEFTVSGADAWLVASQNAEVTDITVSDGGRMKTSGTGAIITGIDVGSGGAASFGQGNTVTDLIVLSGGSLYTGNNFKVYNAVVSSGATWSKTNTAQVGGRNTDIKQGVVYGLVDLGVDFYISGGVASNLDLTSRTVGGQSYNQLHLLEVTVSGGFVNDKTRLVVSSTNSADDAEVYDLTVRTGGSASFQAGLLVSNLKVETNTSVGFGDNVKCIDLDIADGATVNFGTYKNINLGGSKTVIAAGVVTNNVLGADFAAATGIGTDLEVANTYNVNILDGFTVSSGNVLAGGMLAISNGGVASATTVQTDGALNVLAGATVSDLVVSTGARVDFVRDALFAGADTNVAASTFHYDGAADALGFSIRNGVVSDLGSDGKAYRIRLGDGLVVSDAVVRDDWRISAFGDAVISGAAVIVGGTTSAAILLKGSNTAYNVTLTGGSYQAVLNLDGAGASASGTVVNSGGKIGIGADAVGGIENTVIKAGGRLMFSAGVTAASTGEHLTLDFTGGSSVEINKLNLVNSTTRVEANGLAVGGTYTLTTGTATAAFSVCCDATALYDNAVQGGATYTNAFAGKTWNFSTGKSIAVTEFSIGEAKSTAGAITTADTALNTNDRAAKWDATTSYTDSVTLADNSLAGDAWLVIDGTNISTALYGASGNYAHTVNINAKSGTIRNLAAGAQTGDTVGAVNLIFAGAELDGTGYAGGFGNVTGEVKTQIAAGTFAKDFYAGALANKLTTATGVGDISMTIDGGTFDGNIYGASAVKTNTAKGNGTRHTVGNVALTITDGETTQGKQACIFAGGYATGDATGTVYTVDSVTATISGGDWGEAAGGRGVFGGIMASGVTAQVTGDVNITISGDATMGNVYGGGWAQKSGAKSIVGDVNLTISGGNITNVFGGGSHSSSGGTTETGNITITVSGGNITGDIYARGQLDGDTTGAASVIFTGAENFSCGVFGYSYVGGAGEGAALSFSDYTGTFSGNVGGFDDVAFADGTAMTLSTEAGNVSNGAWEFDLIDRANALAGTSLLTWSDADFANDTIKVSFADETQAKGGWNIAAVAEAFSGTTFDVEIGGAEIATGLAYNQQIATGDYAGWGFALDEGVLKFKQLA